jgi:rhodanese-related sulfurtransferase
MISPEDEATAECSVAEAHEAVLDGGLLLDVREGVEWEQGHAPHAVHIPMSQLSDRVGELPRDRTILCVCHVGARSAVVADALNRAGWRARNVAGGMEAWAAAGYPVVVDGAGGPRT